MTETFDSYKEIIENLQNKIKELREKNLKLEDKLINTISARSQNYHLTISVPPEEEKIHKLVINFINSSKIELKVVSKSISSDILDLILEKLDDLENISIITTKRHQMYGEDDIHSFDTLASIPKIHHFINPNFNSTFIIKDKKEILLISGVLKKSDFTSKLNIGLQISEKYIVISLVIICLSLAAVPGILHVIYPSSGFENNDWLS